MIVEVVVEENVSRILSLVRVLDVLSLVGSFLIGDLAHRQGDGERNAIGLAAADLGSFKSIGAGDVAGDAFGTGHTSGCLDQLAVCGRIGIEEGIVGIDTELEFIDVARGKLETDGVAGIVGRENGCRTAADRSRKRDVLLRRIDVLSLAEARNDSV